MQWFVQVQWSSLRPTQLPLMCVELATSLSGVSILVWGMYVVGVLWILGNEAGTPDPTNIPGNTALPPQELVVDNYTNLLERYQCAPVLINGTTLNSNEYEPKIERKLRTNSSVSSSQNC